MTLAYVGNPIDVIKKLHSDQKWDDIVLFCKKMLESDPKDLVALQNMAMASLSLGRFDDVVLYADEVLLLNDFDEYALKNKILALEKLGKHQEIFVLCDKMLSKNPTHTWALNSKGLACNELGQHDSAISYYDKTLSIEPNNVTALLNKAVTLSFLGKFEDAIKFYDLAQQQEKQIKTSMAKSEAYQKLGKEEEAFLAAQGLLVSDIEKYVIDAHAKKMKVFDYYCMMEYDSLEKRESDHQKKLDSKLR